MQKLTLAIALALCSSAVLAMPLDSKITFDPVQINHNSLVNFDLAKGHPVGLVTDVPYTFTCQTSAKTEVIMDFDYAACTAQGCPKWNYVKVNGVDVGSIFKLPINGQIEVGSLYYTDPAFHDALVIKNLDNQEAVTLTCSAVPVATK